MASAVAALAIVNVGGCMTYDCVYFYLAEQHSGSGVPAGVSVVIFAILVLLIMVGGYAVYRLMRFGIKGS